MIFKKVVAGLAALSLAVINLGLSNNYAVAYAEGEAEETTAGTEKSTSIVGKADIVFAIDSTGSMSSYIESVKKNLTNFVNSLNSKGVSLNMSVVEFKDIEEDGVDSTVYYDFDGSHWTSDVNKV
uniref:VWA domain-containing protein n=1 Tax=uncultured Ruminococcus sp. TaxID=165186 RepID=UPI00342AE58D